MHLSDKKRQFCWFYEISKCKLFITEKAKLLAAKQADNYIGLVMVARVGMKAI